VAKLTPNHVTPGGPRVASRVAGSPAKHTPKSRQAALSRASSGDQAIHMGIPAPSTGAERETTDLPPGPRLPVAVQTCLYWRHSDHYLRSCRRFYGDVFTVRAFPAGTIVFLADPRDIKAVFTGDPEVFHAGEGNSVLKPVMGERSVLLLDEKEHIAQRRRMLPAFHGDSVSRYREVVESATHAEIDRWSLDRPFKLMPAMRRITLEVILRAVIGARDPQRLAALRTTLPRVADVGGAVMLLWVWPELGRVGPWRRYQQEQARADDLLYQEIAEHRADPGLGQRTDVLSLLMHQEQVDPAGPDDLNLRDQLVTLLLAGHETTTTALAWAFERLLRHPIILSRLSNSIATGQDDYLDAVVKEILRLRPVIHDVARVLTVPTEVAGYHLRAGTVVSPSIGLVQSNNANFPDANVFRPERFLDGQPSPYSWIPFGGGTRRCLGAAFATFEMKTILRTILTRTQLQPVGARSEGTRAHHITLVPRRGAKVCLVSRTHFQPPRDSATDPGVASSPQEPATGKKEVAK
jgi:cytochrome P450 family 135